MNAKLAGVAVVTRTKNRPLLLRRAIESVLGQTHQDWVHVIVNDGGDPAPVEALTAEYRDRYADRLTVVHNPESLGMEAASNVGVRATDSTFVTIHDDDDAWHPEFLAKTLPAIAAWPGPDCRGAVAYSERVVERIEGDRTVELFRDSFNSWMQTIEIYRLAASNTFPPISFVFRRDALDEIGLFDESLPVLGDWDFHLRFLLHFEIALVREHLAYYYHREQTDSSTYGNTVTAGVERHNLYRSLLVNKWTREDVKAGRLAVSSLVAMSSDAEFLKAKAARVDRSLDSAHGLAQKTPFRQLLRMLRR